MPTNLAQDTLTVTVHIDSFKKGGLTYLNWYYNGMAGTDLRMFVPANCGKIAFQLDNFSSRRYRLVGKTIERYGVADEVYEDLEILKADSAGDEDPIIVSDAQLHLGVAVGRILLLAEPRQVDATEIHHPRTLVSDPEVINNGNQL